jgi:hypothetical protein
MKESQYVSCCLLYVMMCSKVQKFRTGPPEGTSLKIVLRFFVLQPLCDSKSLAVLLKLNKIIANYCKFVFSNQIPDHVVVAK